MAVQVMVVVPTGYGAVSAFPSLRVPTGVRAPAQVSVAADSLAQLSLRLMPNERCSSRAI